MDQVKSVTENQPRWQRWLHRIGYFTTFLVFVELALLGYLATQDWLDRRQFSADLTEKSRTHETSLLPNGDPYVRGNAIRLLTKLPPLNSLHGNGLRFVAMPSFGTTDYGISIFLEQPDASHATGVLITVNKRESKSSTSQRQFDIPVSAYRSFVTRLDKLTDDWPGDENSCLDGSPAAFERVRGNRITSGIGNCSKHYDQLRFSVLDVVRRYAPGDDLPTEDDWHRFEPGER